MFYPKIFADKKKRSTFAVANENDSGRWMQTKEMVR